MVLTHQLSGLRGSVFLNLCVLNCKVNRGKVTLLTNPNIKGTGLSELFLCAWFLLFKVVPCLLFEKYRRQFGKQLSEEGLQAPTLLRRDHVITQTLTFSLGDVNSIYFILLPQIFICRILGLCQNLTSFHKYYRPVIAINIMTDSIE